MEMTGQSEVGTDLSESDSVTPAPMVTGTVRPWVIAKLTVGLQPAMAVVLAPGPSEITTDTLPAVTVMGSGFGFVMLKSTGWPVPGYRGVLMLPLMVKFSPSKSVKSAGVLTPGVLAVTVY